jgi:hypothetical protein
LKVEIDHLKKPDLKTERAMTMPSANMDWSFFGSIRQHPDPADL